MAVLLLLLCSSFNALRDVDAMTLGGGGAVMSCW
jgi:hypothetical protein